MLFLEKLIDYTDISSQKFQSMRMVVLDRLRNIDHIDFVFPEEQVILTQICMN